jgi:hypothetical protein
MAEVGVPDPAAMRIDSLRLRTPTQRNRSLWTGASKAIGLPGAELWSGAVSIELLSTEAQERQWRAFLWALGGPQNWFRMPLPCAEHPGGGIFVDEVGATGYTLDIASSAISQTLLDAGQFLTIPLPSGRFRTVCLQALLATDAAGKATASFRPALTESPVAGATIISRTPFMPFSPADDDLAITWAEGIGQIAFDVEEAR